MPPDIEVLLLRLIGGDATAPARSSTRRERRLSRAARGRGAGDRAGQLNLPGSSPGQRRTPPRPGIDSLSPSPPLTWTTTPTCSTPWSATTCPTTPTTSSPPGSPPSARTPTNGTNERNNEMSATRSNDRDERLAHASRHVDHPDPGTRLRRPPLAGPERVGTDPGRLGRGHRRPCSGRPSPPTAASPPTPTRPGPSR